MQNSLNFKISLQTELSFEQLSELVRSLPNELKVSLLATIQKDLSASLKNVAPTTKEQHLESLLRVSEWTEEDIKGLEESRNYVNEWKITAF